MESPLEVGPSWEQGPGGPERSLEQSFLRDLRDWWAICGLALETGAAADLVCHKWIANHNLFLQKLGLPKMLSYSAAARFKFGDGRVGEVKRAADIEVGIPGCKGASAASVLDAEIPALLRKGALGAPGGHLDLERDISTIPKRSVRVPLRVNEMGHYVLSVVEFGKGPPRSDRGPNLAASYSEWSFVEKQPDLSDGG